MTSLALLCLSMVEFSEGDMVGVFHALVPIVGAIALFGIFLPVAVWTGHRKEEREAFYRAETLRRLAEASGDGAKAAIEMLREDEKLKEIKRREGMKVGGLVTLGVGVALALFLHFVAGEPGVDMVGLIPGLVGVALLVYVYFMAAPIE